LLPTAQCLGEFFLLAVDSNNYVQQVVLSYNVVNLGMTGYYRRYFLVTTTEPFVAFGDLLLPRLKKL
jgi:hypothetical protein